MSTGACGLESELHNARSCVRSACRTRLFDMLLQLTARSLSQFWSWCAQIVGRSLVVSGFVMLGTSEVASIMLEGKMGTTP